MEEIMEYILLYNKTTHAGTLELNETLIQCQTHAAPGEADSKYRERSRTKMQKEDGAELLRFQALGQVFNDSTSFLLPNHWDQYKSYSKIPVMRD